MNNRLLVLVAVAFAGFYLVLDTLAIPTAMPSPLFRSYKSPLSSFSKWKSPSSFSRSEPSKPFWPKITTEDLSNARKNLRHVEPSHSPFSFQSNVNQGGDSQFYQNTRQQLRRTGFNLNPVNNGEESFNSNMDNSFSGMDDSSSWGNGQNMPSPMTTTGSRFGQSFSRGLQNTGQLVGHTTRNMLSGFGQSTGLNQPGASQHIAAGVGNMFGTVVGSALTSAVGSVLHSNNPGNRNNVFGGGSNSGFQQNNMHLQSSFGNADSSGMDGSSMDSPMDNGMDGQDDSSLS